MNIESDEGIYVEPNVWMQHVLTYYEIRHEPFERAMSELLRICDR